MSMYARGKKSDVVYFNSTVDFIPFGIGNGDSVVPPAIDASSPVIQLDYPLLFFKKEYTDLYVSLYCYQSF